jgi:hypothetical protein
LWSRSPDAPWNSHRRLAGSTAIRFVLLPICNDWIGSHCHSNSLPASYARKRIHATLRRIPAGQASEQKVFPDDFHFSPDAETNITVCRVVTSRDNLSYPAMKSPSQRSAPAKAKSGLCVLSACLFRPNAQRKSTAPISCALPFDHAHFYAVLKTNVST